MHANENKKNARSIVVIALLVVLIATLAFGGYSLSKYIASNNVSGTASVAKWGYKVEVTGTELFGSNYKFTDNNSIITSDSTNLTVKAASGKVVAPGTTGKITFKVTGNAEVAAKLTFDLSVTSDVCLKFDTDQEYYPIKWTLKKTGVTPALVNGGKLSEVKTELATKDTTYEPNNAVVDEEYELSWVWDFEQEGNHGSGVSYDQLDTTLGLLKAGKAGVNVEGTSNAINTSASKTEIDFTLTIKVEQLPQR